MRTSSRTALVSLFRSSFRLCQREPGALTGLSLVGLAGMFGVCFLIVYLDDRPTHGVGSVLAQIYVACAALYCLVSWVGAALSLLVADVWWRGRARRIREYLFRAGEYLPELFVIFLRYSPWCFAALILSPYAAIGFLPALFSGLATVLQNAEAPLAAERGREVIWENLEAVGGWLLAVVAVFNLVGRLVPNAIIQLALLCPLSVFLLIFPVLLFLEHGRKLAEQPKAESIAQDFRQRKTG